MSVCEYAVAVEGLWKSFGGKWVLRGARLRARWGEITYLLGPNGAGKTTLIRHVVGLYRADRGVVRTLCNPPGGPGWGKVVSRLGYVPENADVYERLTGLEILEFYARLYGGEDWREMLSEGVRLSGLNMEDLRRRAGSYSKGMRRRLLVAAALMRRPSLLVLDEPFSGVDVLAAYRLKRELREHVSRGLAVLATSHNILEAEKMADRIVFIHEGVILYEGTVKGALDRYGAESLEEAFARAVAR